MTEAADLLDEQGHDFGRAVAGATGGVPRELLVLRGADRACEATRFGNVPRIDLGRGVGTVQRFFANHAEVASHTMSSPSGKQVELGDVEHAREQLDVLAVDDFAPLPRDGNWMVGAAILATVCHLVGDRTRAAVLYEQPSRYEDSTVVAGLPADILGSAHHFLMLLAATSENWDQFERHAREALARNERMGARPWLATTQVELAGVLTARDRPGDRERADGLLNACLETCRELGMPALASRAEAARR